MSVKILIEHSSFQDNAKVVGVINEGETSSQEDKALEELESLRLDLDQAERLRAAIISLEASIREQDRPRARTIIQQLTSGITSSLLANLISNIIKPFL